MSTTTKTIGSRVNSEVHTLFTDVCNKEGITMSQKINQLVTDCVSFPSKTTNKVESNLLLSQVDEDRKLLDSMPRETLDEKIRIYDSKIRKEEKVEPKFTPSKAELDEIIQSVSSNISKHIEQLNKQIQELTTKQNKKIVEDNMKKGICSFNERSAFQ